MSYNRYFIEKSGYDPEEKSDSSHESDFKEEEDSPLEEVKIGEFSYLSQKLPASPASKAIHIHDARNIQNRGAVVTNFFIKPIEMK